MKKIALNVLGVLLILFGVIWFLQGINVLLGSPMSGDLQWTVWGTLAAVVGGGLLVYVNKPRAPSRPHGG